MIINPPTIALKPGRPLLGLDVGSRRIGVALSDRNHCVASALTVVKRDRLQPTLSRLMALIGDHDVQAIIVGLPLMMSGDEGPSCQSVREFARALEISTALPILFQDERLSTVVAERMLIDAGTRRRKRRTLVDKVAATYILQGALEGLRDPALR